MLYEVVLRQRYQNQECVNRFNYVDDGGVSTITRSIALLNKLGFLTWSGTPLIFPSDTVAREIQGMQHNGVTFLGVSCRAVYDPTDFYEVIYPTGIVGSQTGEGLAPFVAFGFRTNRIRQDISRGTKRFVGVAETAVGDGGTLTPVFLTGLNNAAAAMSADVTYSDGGSLVVFTPVVVKRNKVELEPNRFSYRYFPTLEQQVANLAVGVTWQAYTQVRSQTSRQYGRGS